MLFFTYLSFRYSSFSTNAMRAQSTVLESVVVAMSSSCRVLHHFFTNSSKPSLLLVQMLLPATCKYSMSQQGSRTNVESVMLLHPQMSRTLNFADFFGIRSIWLSSIPSK